MKRTRIVMEVCPIGKRIAYRALEDITAEKPSYGLEIEYIENDTAERAALMNITADKEEILKMLGDFFDGCVFPNVFEETALNYIKTKIFNRIFSQ